MLVRCVVLTVILCVSATGSLLAAEGPREKEARALSVAQSYLSLAERGWKEKECPAQLVPEHEKIAASLSSIPAKEVRQALSDKALPLLTRMALESVLDRNGQPERYKTVGDFLNKQVTAGPGQPDVTVPVPAELQVAQYRLAWESFLVNPFPVGGMHAHPRARASSACASLSMIGDARSPEVMQVVYGWMSGRQDEQAKEARTVMFNALLSFGTSEEARRNGLIAAWHCCSSSPEAQGERQARIDQLRDLLAGRLDKNKKEEFSAFVKMLLAENNRISNDQTTALDCLLGLGLSGRIDLSAAKGSAVAWALKNIAILMNTIMDQARQSKSSVVEVALLRPGTTGRIEHASLLSPPLHTSDSFKVGVEKTVAGLRENLAASFVDSGCRATVVPCKQTQGTDEKPAYIVVVRQIPQDQKSEQAKAK